MDERRLLQKPQRGGLNQPGEMVHAVQSPERDLCESRLFSRRLNRTVAGGRGQQADTTGIVLKRQPTPAGVAEPAETKILPLIKFSNPSGVSPYFYRIPVVIARGGLNHRLALLNPSGIFRTDFRRGLKLSGPP